MLKWPEYQLINCGSGMKPATELILFNSSRTSFQDMRMHNPNRDKSITTSEIK